MTTSRTICQEAHEILLALEETHGDPVNLWRRIADTASRRTGVTVSAESALWVLIETELELQRRGPTSASHLRNAVLFLGVLAKVRAVDEAEAKTWWRHAGVSRRTS